jgi:3-dehydroquinate dehydratase/shikimate dehydrogenase
MRNSDDLFHGRCGLIGVISGSSIKDALFQLQKFEKKVDGIELRLDLLSALSKKQIRELQHNFTIFTWKNGAISQVKNLLDLEPTFLDLDWTTPLEQLEEIAHAFPRTKIITSYHNFEMTPHDLEGILKQMRNPLASVYKMATRAHSSLDSLRMLHFCQEQHVVGCCMGDKGALSRILAPLVGTPWVYASADSEHATAEGQLSSQTLEETYHFRTLSPSSSIYGLLGKPLIQSPSHLTHNALLQKLKKDAVYVKIELEKEELAPFFAMITPFSFKGFSVTIPFKEEIFRCVNHVEDKAQKMGAINTLVSCNGQWHGYNTDASGALDVIEQRMRVLGKKMVLLGAGGVARAIAYEATQRGAHLLIQSRTEEKAKTLAKSLNCKGTGLEKVSYDILINATPSTSPIPQEWLIPTTLVMDLSPSPRVTPFLKRAQELNCQIIDGFEMFLEQAKGQFALWFPEQIDRAAQELEKIRTSHFAASTDSDHSLQ